MSDNYKTLEDHLSDNIELPNDIPNDFPSSQSQDHSPPSLNPKIHLEKVHSSDNFLQEPTKEPNKKLSFYPLKPQKLPENMKNFTQTEIFHQACLERKKNSFNSLKNWDLKRARFLTLHRNILETIQERLAEHVRNSQILMQTLIKYLKDRAIQELNYSKQNIENLDFEENSYKEQKIYHNFLSEICFSAKIHKEHCDKVELFGTLIEKSLLSENLLIEKSLYDKSVEKFNENLMKIKKNLTKLNIEASEKSAKYSTLYFSMINAPFGKKTEKDLYRREISFLRTANEQMKIQRKLAIETFLYWQTLKELEGNRVKIMKNSMELYLNEFQKTYSFLTSEFIENFKENDNRLSLELKDILSFEEINTVINQAKEFTIIFEELSFEKLKGFFQEFVIKANGDEVLLIMKEMKTVRNIGGILSNYVNCRLILTVDGFLLCFDQNLEENEWKKPAMVVNLETTTAIKTKDEQYIEITRTKPGFLMNTIEKFLFKFASKEEVEELLEYLNRYYSK